MVDTCTVNKDSILPADAKDLLAKLEEENRRLELLDKHSITSLPPRSRKGSDASEISVVSGTSSNQDGEPQKSSSSVIGDENLWNVWGVIVNNWETEWKKRNQYVRNLVRKGVPHHFRGIVWQLLSGAENSPEKKLYAKYIKSSSSCEKVIRRDISRTYPEHDFFKQKDGLGQESLFNVMKAYSLHDREVGYCQGSGFIVGLLLMQMPEEEAFAVLVRIMEVHRMRDMFKPSMAELGLCMYQLENLLKELIPEIYTHFQVQGFTTSIYASSWFLTLFATTLSLPLACRIMDVFLSEGIEIIFKVSLAMLTLGLSDILSLDMENLLRYIQKELPVKVEADPDSFMTLAYNINVNCKKMKRLEKEYMTIRAKEQSELALQRCLRQENKILKQRVEFLEGESAALAKRLVQGQVDRAEGEEETFALAQLHEQLRKAFMDTQQKLAEAQEEVKSLELTIHEVNNSRQSSLDGGDICTNSDLSQCLQRELVRARLEAAEREVVERDLNDRIVELENENKSLREQKVDNNVAHLQDELIAVKLREAEANLSLKELRQSVAEFSECWAKFVRERKDNTEPGSSKCDANNDNFFMSTPKKILRALEGRTDTLKSDEFMSDKLKKMEALAEINELRLKVMELETQVQISTNHLRRKEDEIRNLKEQVESAAEREKVLHSEKRELQHKFVDLESKAKYDTMQANIKSLEDTQKIAELENLLSELKMTNEMNAVERAINKHNF